MNAINQLQTQRVPTGQRAKLLGVAFALLLAVAAPSPAADDPVAPWKQDVRIAPVSPTPGRHTTHSYYVANPESPDGKRVLFFASTHPAAHVGSVVILDRATGKETVLAENVHTEDAHRAACQQWLSGGKRVAFHEVVGKRWRVVAVDTATLAKTVVAEDHQVGFGQPSGDLLPLYGCHWNPGPFRDLEIWDATTGKLRTAAKISEVEGKYGEWLQKEFAGKPASIFFPVISPDLRRVFFKIAAGNGGDDFMSKDASHRQGIVCYDFDKAACIWQHPKWGHPAWHPDSRRILEMGNLLHDTSAPPGTYARIQDVPVPRGTHPSVSPDGTLLVTDGVCDNIGAKPNDWGIVVGSLAGGSWVLLHSFDQSKGAMSWRRNHPHPVFSADSKRIYFNVSEGEFTRLFVAERK
jgi:hypothetical protein